MTKEEKIKEAWGEYYNEIEFYLTESGFMPYVYDVRMIRNENKIEFEHLPNHANLFRPKSLQGIEDNNGWVKIESEDDLPKEDCNVFILHKTYGIITDKYKSAKKDFHYNCKKNITYYQPIATPEPPLI